ncbi:MAG: response regulator [Desulfamplus sp.]|nr:response regulator [Desulfamplus sp.]
MNFLDHKQLQYTVLVVDDVVENIDVLRGALSDEYRIRATTSGKAALSAAAKNPQPDIILLDIMMPEMDGYEVCRRLKKNPLTSHIPVIFVTAKNEEVDELKGFETGAVDYINKPISGAITKARIKTHLALSNQQKYLEHQVQEKTRELHETRLEIIKRLGKAAEYKDNDTGLHIERISRYCYHIAKSLGLDESQAYLIMQASPMHDIGKIGVPDHVLKKPGKLDEIEWSQIVPHPEIGAGILDGSRSELLDTARIIALQHHEKWDGTGYPSGLQGEDIHMFARITAVADVFDALTSKRPYKKAWPSKKAVEHITLNKGTHFDPQIVDAFIKILPEILAIQKQFDDKP